MIKYDLNIFKKASNNLLFTMEEAQYKVLLEEFDVLVQQLVLLEELGDLSLVEPMDFPYEINRSIFRSDCKGKPASREKILKNAGDKYANQIRVPKVVK